MIRLCVVFQNQKRGKWTDEETWALIKGVERQVIADILLTPPIVNCSKQEGYLILIFTQRFTGALFYILIEMLVYILSNWRTIYCLSDEI